MVTILNLALGPARTETKLPFGGAMKRKKHSRSYGRVPFAVAAVVAAAALAACGSSSTGASTSSTSASPGATVQQDLPPLRVGIAVDPPWTTKAASGDLEGFLPDLLMGLGKELGREIVYVETGWTGIVAGLQTGQYDMIGADLNATAERAKVIDFTLPYSGSGMTWFVKKGSPLKTLADLNNPDITIAFVSGSDGETTTKKALPLAKYRGLGTGSKSDLIAEVETGRSDALAISNYVGQILIDKYGQVAIPSLEEQPDGVDPVGIGWAVGKGDAELQGQIDAYITKMEASGELATLKEKYLTAKAFASAFGFDE